MSVVGELVANVKEEAGFDASETQILGWLNRRHERMCARSRCFRERLQIGPTVAEQMSYTVPPRVLEIHEVTVQSSAVTGGLGVPYGAGRHRDLAEGALGYIWLGGLYRAVGSGIFVRDSDTSGNTLLSLYPTPTEAGLRIELYAVCRPPALSTTATGLTVGNPATFRFSFTTRALTEAETITFVAGGGLPAGVGYDPEQVRFVYQAPGEPWVTLEGASVIKDAVGAYHAVLTPKAAGTLLWFGKGFEGATEVAATPQEEVVVSSGAPGSVQVPPEFYDDLVAGAVATGLTRIENRSDLAAPLEAQYASACQELLTQTNKRFRGAGPSQIRVAGFNA